MNHYDAAVFVKDRLKRVSGISKIVLFGSVARGEEKKKSDIDIIFVVDDNMRVPDHGCYDWDLNIIRNIEEVLFKARKITGYHFHTGLFSDSQYKEGIQFGSIKGRSGDYLSDVGKVLFSRN